MIRGSAYYSRSYSYDYYTNYNRFSGDQHNFFQNFSENLKFICFECWSFFICICKQQDRKIENQIKCIENRTSLKINKSYLIHKLKILFRFIEFIFLFSFIITSIIVRPILNYYFSEYFENIHVKYRLPNIFTLNNIFRTVFILFIYLTFSKIVSLILFESFIFLMLNSKLFSATGGTYIAAKSLSTFCNEENIKYKKLVNNQFVKLQNIQTQTKKISHLMPFLFIIRFLMNFLYLISLYNIGDNKYCLIPRVYYYQLANLNKEDIKPIIKQIDLNYKFVIPILLYFLFIFFYNCSSLNNIVNLDLFSNKKQRESFIKSLHSELKGIKKTYNSVYKLFSIFDADSIISVVRFSPSIEKHDFKMNEIFNINNIKINFNHILSMLFMCFLTTSIFLFNYINMFNLAVKRLIDSNNISLVFGYYII